MNWAAILWFSLLVVFLIAEAATVTMVSLWFAAGALVGLLVSLFQGPVWLQIVSFLAVSAVLLSALRPIARKLFTPRLTRTNVDSVIGSKGLVTVTVDNIRGEGQVKLGAMEWTARSTAGETIEKGTLVKVDRIEGVKVFVTPVEVLETV